MINNIYLCGHAGSGKSYCAEYLKKKGYIIANVAYPIYNLAYDYFNMDHKVKDRKLLQTISIDVARNYDNDIWLTRFFQDIRIVRRTRELLEMPECSFITADCRFINEHKMFQYHKWTGIYLDVSEEICIKRLHERDNTAQHNTLTHATEVAIDEFKHELVWIDASGTLQNMYDNLDVAITKGE